ncbi:MAG: hypothetical protein M3N98_09470 [Actinomycetota bacterium]|nr:hypothetical protein [Actinomycetota bacterium]
MVEVDHLGNTSVSSAERSNGEGSLVTVERAGAGPASIPAPARPSRNNSTA